MEKNDEEQTAAELAAEEQAAAIARGDVVEEDVAEEDIVAEEEEEEEEDAAAEPPEELAIPKARFDEAQKKARARQRELEARIAEMEQAQRSAPVDVVSLEAEIEALQDQYEDKLLEGDLEEARQLRRQANAKQKELTTQTLAQTSRATGQAAVEQMRFDAQLAQFEAKHSAINPDSENFDQATANEVSEMLQAFKATGLTATAALNKAMHYVLPDEGAPAGRDPGIVRSQRAQKARKAVKELADKSPPDIHDKGRNSDKTGSGDGLPDPLRLSQAQFDKLTEAELRELRQDSLAAAG